MLAVNIIIKYFKEKKKFFGWLGDIVLHLLWHFNDSFVSLLCIFQHTVSIASISIDIIPQLFLLLLFLIIMFRAQTEQVVLLSA